LKSYNVINTQLVLLCLSFFPILLSIILTMEPPQYSDESTSDVLKPTTLYAAGRFVYTADPQSPPAYEFSHSINFLSDSDRKVIMERLDYGVRTVNGAPSVTTRKRTLFDLAHRTLGELPNFTYQAEAKSRAVSGSMGIEQKKKGLTRRMEYRVCMASWGADRRLAGGAPLFTASPPRGAEANGVSWEWSDAQDQLLAREVTNDELASLVITAEMTASVRDALVAAWIMRIWWDLAEGKFGSSHRHPLTSYARTRRWAPV
jgi:hypothetical protein